MKQLCKSSDATHLNQQTPVSLLIHQFENTLELKGWDADTSNKHADQRRQASEVLLGEGGINLSHESCCC